MSIEFRPKIPSNVIVPEKTTVKKGNMQKITLRQKRAVFY